MKEIPTDTHTHTHTHTETERARSIFHDGIQICNFKLSSRVDN